VSICFVPRTTDEIRAWLCQVLVPSVAGGAAETMTVDELHATWERTWRPLVENSVELMPNPMELAEIRELATRVRVHVRLEALTPAQLVLFLRPYRDAVNQAKDKARVVETRIRTHRAKARKADGEA